jgi:predicted RNase H-like nuclease (RuvC/YqgF family)
MEGLEIGKIVAEFMMTAVVLYLCNQQIVTLKDQIKERDDQIERLEVKLDKCHEEHRKDLRDWRKAESDTKLRLTMQEREILAERARNSGGNSAD